MHLVNQIAIAQVMLCLLSSWQTFLSNIKEKVIVNSFVLTFKIEMIIDEPKKKKLKVTILFEIRTHKLSMKTFWT